jgi:hypothetical protein
MDKDYKKAFENILKGKLYYKNSNEYHQANDIIYNHPFIQDLIKKAERLEVIESADGGEVLELFDRYGEEPVCRTTNTKWGLPVDELNQENWDKIRNYILKSQQQAKELEEIKREHFEEIVNLLYNDLEYLESNPNIQQDRYSMEALHYIKQALIKFEELKGKARELLNQLDNWYKPYDCGYNKWVDGISDLQFDLEKLVGDEDE